MCVCVFYLSLSNYTYPCLIYGYLSLSRFESWLSVIIYLDLFVCLPLFLPLIYLSLFPSIHVSIYYVSVCCLSLSIYLSVYLLLYQLFVCLSICLFVLICLSIHLSMAYCHRSHRSCFKIGIGLSNQSSAQFIAILLRQLFLTHMFLDMALWGHLGFLSGGRVVFVVFSLMFGLEWHAWEARTRWGPIIPGCWSRGCRSTTAAEARMLQIATKIHKGRDRKRLKMWGLSFTSWADPEESFFSLAYASVRFL